MTLKLCLPSVSHFPSKEWKYGPSEFVSYMNHVYLPNQGIFKKKLVYKKRGTTGIAGQMKGACDTLLLAILSNRTFQSICFHSISQVVITPAISKTYFDFPLSNVSFPTLENTSFSLTLDHRSQRIRGLDWVGSFSKAYHQYDSILLLSNHVFSHSVIYRMGNHPDLKRIRIESELKKYECKERRNVWYNMCIPNLFQLNSKSWNLLQPYLKQFDGFFVIGVHLRFSGKLASWNDNRPYMTKEGVDRIIDEIQKIQRDQLRVFLASDSSTIVSRFQFTFRDQLIYVHEYSLEHVGRNATQSGMIRSILDLYLLSNCDQLFLTRHSHYSLVAMHLSTKPIGVTIV